MFTGIVEEVGVIEAARREGDKRLLRIAAEVVTDDLTPGASIAVNGVCQTVVEYDARGFSVEAIRTTLERTTLGNLAEGEHVNLERPLALGGRLGGHLVQGHVDGVGTIVRVEAGEEHVLVDVRVPADVAAVTVLHGSITLDGISLTVNALPESGVVQVALIPFTRQHTTLTDPKQGSEVNVEGDLVGRMLARFADQWLDARERGDRDPERER